MAAARHPSLADGRRIPAVVSFGFLNPENLCKSPVAAVCDRRGLRPNDIAGHRPPLQISRRDCIIQPGVGQQG